MKNWLPKMEPTAKPEPGPYATVIEGAPRFRLMHRFKHVDFLEADLWDECCDCGLRHHFTIHIMRDSDGSFYLIRRAYRVPDGAYEMPPKKERLFKSLVAKLRKLRREK